jgi:23S rRNA (adenine2503-C2)-methyltransferase
MDLSPEELSDYLVSLGVLPYRSHQLAKWLFQRNVQDFSVMSDISLRTRSLLSECAEIAPQLEIIQRVTSPDGATKLLNLLPDGLMVESVLIPEKDRLTLCLSSQVGCNLGCAFCRTGTMGLKRNLTQGEILGQITAAQGVANIPISNLVFMGMGEPLNNLTQVSKALDIIIHPRLKAFNHNKVTVSTVGLIPELQTLGQIHPKISLTISLTSADQSLRESLMPIAKKYTLTDLKEALLKYPLPKGSRITISYVIMGGVNDELKDAKALVNYLHGLKVKINLIPFNPWKGAPFKPPLEARVQFFKMYLTDRHFTTVIRKSRGEAVGGACGQLAIPEED